jgi:hypothetical protein
VEGMRRFSMNETAAEEEEDWMRWVHISFLVTRMSVYACIQDSHVWAHTQSQLPGTSTMHNERERNFSLHLPHSPG